MSQVTKNEDSKDTTVKLSKKALNNLEKKAKPFESKKDCIERIIAENCGSSTKPKEEPNEEAKEEE